MSECARAAVQQACDSCEAAPGNTEQQPEAAWPPQGSLVKHPLPDTDDAVDWDAVRNADIEEVRAAGFSHQHAYCYCHSKMIVAVKSTAAANFSCRTRVARSVLRLTPGALTDMHTCSLSLSSKGSVTLPASQHCSGRLCGTTVTSFDRF